MCSLRWLTGPLLLLVLLGTGSALAGDSTLRVGQTARSSVTSPAGDIWCFPLTQGECARLEVTQEQADVRVEIVGPDGQPLTAFQTPDQDSGVEGLRVVSPSSGICLARVTPVDARARGAYQIVLRETRPATPQDQAVMNAQNEYMRAETMREEGSDRSQRGCIALYERAIAVFAAAGETRAQAVSLNSLAIVRSTLGDGAGARRDLQACLVLRRQAGDRAGEAQTLTNLAMEQEGDGDYKNAMANFEHALSIRRDIGDRWGMANSLTHIGASLAAFGDRRAIRAFDLALALWREVGDAKWELFTLVELARVYLNEGNSRAAARCYDRANTLQVSGRGRISLVNALLHLGTLYRGDGTLGEARKRFESALRISTAMGFLMGETLARMNLACTWVDMARSQKGAARARSLRIAHAFGLEALVGSRTVGAEMTASALAVLMLVLDAEGNRRQAIFCGRQAVDTYQRIRRGLAGLAKEMQEQYAQRQSQTYRDLARLLVREGRLPEAEMVLRMLKADEYSRYLRGASNTAPALALTPPPDAARFDALLTRAAELARTCEDMRAAGPLKTDDKARYLALREQLAAANQAVFHFFEEKRASAPSRGAAVSQMEKATAGIMSDLGALGPDVVGVYTLLFDDEYIAIMVTPQARIARSYTPPRGGRFRREGLRANVAALREALQNPAVDPRPRCKAVYDVVVGPIADDLRRYKARTVMWFLDGDLRYVPMAALHDGSKYLVQSFRMETCTLSSLPRLKDVPRKPWRALGLGVSRAFEVKREDAGVDAFPALPFVKDELSVIGASSGEKRFEGRVLLDGAFTADALREALLLNADGSFPLVHIASHFQLVPGDLSRSYLLLGDGSKLPLSWFNERAEQIFRDVDLLTLSACNTATGERTAEGVEIEGFAELAQQQGARAVLATLWPVADTSTAVLMKDFYRQLSAGATKIEALRQAQLGLLEGRIRGPREAVQRAEAYYVGHKPAGDGVACPPWKTDVTRPFSHPFYWAPFVLFGNWK